MSISTERFVTLHIELFKISNRLCDLAKSLECEGVGYSVELWEIIDELSVAAANSLDEGQQQ
jgi:hypothetical protein